MSDSNAQPQPEALQRPRSYTERFSDMENAVARLNYVVNFHTGTITDLMSRIEMYVDKLNAMSNGLNAMMQLAEAGRVLSSQNVMDKMLEIDAANKKQKIVKDVVDGLLSAVEYVENNETVVEYESLPEVTYGYGIVGSFPEETRPLLLGRKVGDLVGSVKILGLYKENAKAEEAKDGKSGQESGNA